jgi:PAS domain S-box-containing protein
MIINEISKEYEAILKDFIAEGGEAWLKEAYSLGRQALDQGIDILDITAAHHQALITLLSSPEASSTQRARVIVKQAGKFLAECLSAFEMAQRGFREIIVTLNQLNEALEDKVEQRTQAMRASEERYRTLIEISPDAITVTDLQGKVILCNQQSLDLHGCSSPDELIGNNASSFIAPEDAPRIREITQRVIIDEGITGTLEYTLMGKNGKRTPVEVKTTLLRDEQGKPTGFIGMTRDISERKQAQLNLEAYARRQAAVADLGLRALSGFVEIDTLMHEMVSLVSQTLNVECCGIFELLPEEDGLLLHEGIGWQEGAVGNTIIESGAGSQAGYTLSKAEPVIVEHLPTESRFTPPPFLMEHNIVASLTVIIHRKDQPYGVLGAYTSQKRQFIMEDVTFLRTIANMLAMAIDNRRLLETETKARQRAEEDGDHAIKSLAIVSHEFRTPLTSIKGFASTLLADDVVWSAEQQRDFIRTIDEEANKLSGFIDQLLDLSRMDAGVFKFSISRQSVKDLITASMTHLETLTQQHHLVINIQDTLPDVFADSQRIEQVLSNLVENATKYAPPETTITISAQSHENFVKISVADEGPGIPIEEREKVFRPFYLVADKTTLKAKGVGLGLAICQRLVEGQRGHIWVDEHPGPGAIIHFTLPFVERRRYVR